MSLKSIRFVSLPYKGPRLFNSIPQNIRNLTDCDVTTFKGALDKFLLSLPDQPLLPNMTHLRVCETNSVVDWVSRHGVDTQCHRRGQSLFTRTVTTNNPVLLTQVLRPFSEYLGHYFEESSPPNIVKEPFQRE